MKTERDTSFPEVMGKIWIRKYLGSERRGSEDRSGPAWEGMVEVVVPDEPVSIIFPASRKNIL
jgi:hypothetical protein|tara:strand:+ start:370 stop:558 length:189 start_codon:yes stop_codon:yes gene_type:complete